MKRVFLRMVDRARPLFARLHDGHLAAAAIAVFALFSLLSINMYSQGIDERFVYLRGQFAVMNFSALVSHAPLPAPGLLPGNLVYYTPLFAVVYYFAAEIAGLLPFLDCLSAPHITTLLFSCAGLGGLFFLTRRLFNDRVALFSVLFLILHPHFVGYSHVNPKDLPLAVMAIFTMVAVHRYLCLRTMSAAMGAGLVMGLAVATHLNALVFLPLLVVGTVALDLAWGGGAWRSFCAQWLAHMVGAIAVASVVLYMSWPSLWRDPLFVFEAIAHFKSGYWAKGGHVFFLGQTYQNMELPWYFMPFQLMLRIPLPTLILCFFGMVVSLLWPGSPATKVGRLLVLGWLVLPILVRSQTGVVRYAGMRHVFMCVVPAAMFAGCGLAFLLKRLKASQRRGRCVGGILAFLLFGHLTFQMFRIHPFQESYVNGAVSALYAPKVHEVFDFDEHARPYRQAMDWLNANAERDAAVSVFGWLPHVISCYARPDLRFTDAEVAHYVLVRAFDRSFPAQLAGLSRVYTVSAPHADLMYVLRRPDGAG